MYNFSKKYGLSTFQHVYCYYLIVDFLLIEDNILMIGILFFWGKKGQYDLCFTT